MVPEEIKKFINLFSKLPSIGPRQATRLAFYLINSGKNKIKEISDSILGFSNLSTCPKCFFVYSGKSGECNICKDKNRNKKNIMIVEKETDLITIERTGKYRGIYFVIGESAKNGILESWQKLRLETLKKNIENELPDKKADEIIISLNPTTYGDMNSSLIEKELSGHSNKISRLGRGIPTGGEIEFADEDTLTSAIERRN